MKKSLTSRDKQAINTRNKIYKYGVRLMNQYGYENITVEQIAKKSNVSVGTFYHYFKSKFDLLGEVFHIGDLFFQERIEQLMAEHTCCADRISEYFSLYAQLSVNNGIKMVKSLYLPTNKMFITHGRKMQSLLTDILRSGQERGEISANQSPETITEALFVVARGVIFDWCLHDGDSDLIADMSNIVSRQAKSYT